MTVPALAHTGNKWGGCQTAEQLCQKDLQGVPVELGGSEGTMSWRVSAGTAKMVRGSGEAVAVRLVLPGVFSRWLQGGPYSSSPIPMGSRRWSQAPLSWCMAAG